MTLGEETILLPKAPNPSVPPEDELLRFQVELDNRGKARLKCLEGNEAVKEVALNLQGLNALIEQGLMRLPGGLKVGALQDWVELDGDLFRFQQGTTGAGELEKALNQRYLPRAEPGLPVDVEVIPSPASPSGFDIQFPATPSGLVENRKRHLNEESIDLLADPRRCRVLRKGIIAKFIPPDLIFKRRMPDGGENYLAPGPDTVVSVTRDDGQLKSIDLSQPVSLFNLTARELTAVFNHPALNRRARLMQAAGLAIQVK